MIAFLQSHPLLSGLLAAIAILAGVGLWYVIAHHLQAIVVTLICSIGAAAGAVVFWRGISGDMADLIAIGVFMMVIFPIFLLQAIRRERKPVQVGITQVPGVVRPLSGAASIKRH